MIGRPAIALGICPNDLSQRAVTPAAAQPAAGVNSSAPAAPPFQAKASEDNGATGRTRDETPADGMAGEVSRTGSGSSAELQRLSNGRDSRERPALNSPEWAQETRGGLPVAAASGTAEETGRSPVYTRRGRSGTPPVAGVTAGETAPDFTAPSLENGLLATATDKVSRPAVVVLSEASLFILTLVARHDGVTPQAVLTRLIAERGKAIGLSPLLGEHFDDGGAADRETIVMRHHDIRTCTVTREGDLADVPAFERTPGNRFRSGGP